MPLKNVSQRGWLKGLVACFDLFSQPPKTLPRATNLLATNRGGWRTCDGSSLISALNGSVQPLSANLGPIIEQFLYQPIGALSMIYMLQKAYNIHIVSPTVSSSDGGGGGNLSAGTYQWEVTAIDGAGGEATSIGASTPLVLAASHKGIVNIGAPSQGAVGYNVYRTVANGGTFFRVNITPITSFPFTDNIADASLFTAVQPPASNTTQTTSFYAIPPISYGIINLIHNFPAVSFPGGGIGATAEGGVVGGLSGIPQIIQFANLMFLALGNGISPYVSDGTSGNTIPITNTFTAVYPAWAASTAFSTGDQIQATVGGTTYVFIAIQGGITGTVLPTFPANLNQTVTDGTGSAIIWQNTGQVSTSPAPRGAAHAEVYAGSLWVANTSPSLTSDQLDGPSAIRMSDTNNPNSWNPLNAAQISRDNGQQITGLKAFAVADAGIPTTQQLVVFKDFTTFLINGVFGSSDFSIQQAETDQGCMAARTIQFVPGFGIVRMTHLGIGVFDGLRDRVLSEEIRPFLFGDPNNPDINPVDWFNIWQARASQTATPPLYVCAVPLNPTTFTAQVLQPPAPVAGTSLFLSTQVYVRFIAYDVGNNQLGVSQEFGPITVPSNAILSVTSPVFNGAPANTSYFLVAFGYSPNTEFLLNPTQLTPGHTIGVNGAGATPSTPGTIGQLTRLLCYDLVLKAWAGVIDLPFPIGSIKQFRQENQVPQTSLAGYWDGAFRQWQAGDVNWDIGAENATGDADLSVQWALRTAEVFAEGGSQRIFYLRQVIRGTSTQASPTITVTPTYNGVDHTPRIAAIQPMGSNQFDARVELQKTAENFHSTISGRGQVEISSADHQVVPKPIGASAQVFS